MRREPLLAVLLCLLGALVVLVAVGRDWVLVGVEGTGLLPSRTLGVDGGQIVPGVRALGIVALAGVVAVPATRRWGRTVVGLLLLLVGAGIVASVAGVLGDLSTAAQQSDTVRAAGGTGGESARRTLWPHACAVGGLAVASAGLLVTARGRGWAALGRRYEAPVATAVAPPDGPVAERDLWEALDRGDDPTAADPEGRGAGPRD